MLLRDRAIVHAALVEEDALVDALAADGALVHAALVEEDALVDALAADGALVHAVAAHLTGAVAAQEDHVLEAVHAHRAARVVLHVL